MPSNHLIFCPPLLLLPSIFPSIRVFSSESVLRIMSPKYWSLSFSISPSNEYSGLNISFRIDWFDLLAFQGTLKSHLQHHSSKASILWCSDFFMVQLSHLYMTTGKTIALPIQTFVGKVALQSPLSTGILQARLLEWVAMPSSRGSSQPRDRTYVYCLAGRFLTTEPPVKPCPASLGIRKCKSKGQ